MTRQIVAASSLVFAVLPYRPVPSLSLGAQYAMAQRSRRQIYETAFDSKVEKKSEDGGDLIDRIANHPILQLLNLRRRSRQGGQSNGGHGCHRTRTFPGNTVVASTSSDPKFQVGVYTPRGGRRDRGRGLAPRPARSVSTHYITEHRVRPIGLSKSDDEILNRGSDSLDEDDYIEDYIEGQNAKELSADLKTLHMQSDDYFKESQKEKKSSKKKNKKLKERAELSKSQAIPARLPLRPLELRSPPGTAPLPIKFCKRTPIADKSPSSWFSPPRQKDLNLPIKKSLSKELLGLSRNTPPCESHTSLNASMEVLLDSSSQRDIKSCFMPPGVNVKYSSIESVVTGSTMSSLESLRSSMSDGSKSTASNESAMSSYKSSSLGSDSSLLSRPALNLSAPHRSLIQSAKFQILSPISDKSQEPSSEYGCLSQKTSPQDLAELHSAMSRQKTPLQPRNIQEDFRNFHHILPGPPREGDVQGSDSGISIEYGLHMSRKHEAPYSDLPFDMPKLRRRLAAAKIGKTSLSSSNSSISSSGATSEGNPRLSLPPNFQPTVNPAVSRLQVDASSPIESGKLGNNNILEVRSGTSSSNSSDWDTRSSAESSDDQGTPKFRNKDGNRVKSGLALDLGCAAMAIKGEKVDVNLPLMKQGWYHGALSRTEAEATLRSCSEGSYLVRSLDISRHEYSLGLKSARGYMHLRIQFDCKTGQYMLGRGTKQFSSVPHMIQHYSIFRLPIKGAEHMVLLHPVIHETL
ncbi:serine-rich adhesin for platelets isoform X2 [Procambarus clarkii]|uniref:serine-rich adhesin for platelets isoform X2 n=1 Tax=Procambarus clarkii TaxID=6728 RepID=UPI003743F482